MNTLPAIIYARFQHTLHVYAYTTATVREFISLLPLSSPAHRLPLRYQFSNQIILYVIKDRFIIIPIRRVALSLEERENLANAKRSAYTQGAYSLEERGKPGILRDFFYFWEIREFAWNFIESRRI